MPAESYPFFSSCGAKNSEDHMSQRKIQTGIKKKKVRVGIRQKSGSWQTEVPSGMGQQLTQDPQSIKQQGYWIPCNSAKGCGNRALRQGLTPRHRHVHNRVRSGIQQASPGNPKTHWDRMRKEGLVPGSFGRTCRKQRIGAGPERMV